jgi:HD-like signal output (HDOD) protein
MQLFWMGLALVALLALAAGVVTWLQRRPVAAPPPRPRAGRPPQALSQPSSAAAPAVPTARTPSASAPVPVPPGLAAFRPRHADELTPDRRTAFLQVFKDVPRPPRLLHHLLSPDFFGSASSAQLVDLISAEPLIAAKVLATVNSPLYGLNRTVSSIGQAVTYLGLNTVRSLCIQYIVRSSFMADTSQRKQLLEETWTASAMASELAQRLTQGVGVDDRGGLVSAVVLSFLGRVAVVATTPRGILDALPRHGLLEREAAEQDRLGLCSAEIGRLLMTAWGLPTAVVADAADLDRVLVTPAPTTGGPPADERGTRLALGYLCARLGERLASESLTDLAVYDLAADPSPDLFHVRGHLARPPLARLPTLLQSSDVVTALQRLQATAHA